MASTALYPSSSPETPRTPRPRALVLLQTPQSKVRPTPRDVGRPEPAQNLDYACSTGDERTARWVLQQGTTDQQARDEALLLACSNGHVGCVAALLGSGANPNATMLEGGSALALAAQAGSEGCLQQLLQGGALVDGAGKSCATALFVAAFNGRAGCLDLLLRTRAAVDAPYLDGSSALHAAAQAGHTECVRLLVGCGACLELEDEEGYTPLCLAAESGQLAAVRVLLDAGASPKHAAAGLSPLALSNAQGHSEVAECLLNARAAAPPLAASPLPRGVRSVDQWRRTTIGGGDPAAGHTSGRTSLEPSEGRHFYTS